jgi:hypothetical protein
MGSGGRGGVFVWLRYPANSLPRQPCPGVEQTFGLAGGDRSLETRRRFPPEQMYKRKISERVTIKNHSRKMRCLLDLSTDSPTASRTAFSFSPAVEVGRGGVV